MNKLTSAEQDTMNAYNRGRGAYFHPRKDTISLNGFPAIPRREAIKRMRETLEKDQRAKGSPT